MIYLAEFTANLRLKYNYCIFNGLRTPFLRGTERFHLLFLSLCSKMVHSWRFYFRVYPTSTRRWVRACSTWSWTERTRWDSHHAVRHVGRTEVQYDAERQPLMLISPAFLWATLIKPACIASRSARSRFRTLWLIPRKEPTQVDAEDYTWSKTWLTEG